MIDLILPPFKMLSEVLGEEISSEEEFAKFIHKRYTKAWKEVIIASKEAVESTFPKVKELFVNAFRFSLDECGIDEQPPFPLRIIVTSIPVELPKNIEKPYEIYDNAYHKLLEKAQLTKLLRVHPAVSTELTKVTEDLWRTEANGKKYAICTVCGDFPAALEAPYNEQVYGQRIPEPLHTYIDRGENLCGYCVVKRLGTYPEVLSAVVEKLIGLPKGRLKFSFPSTGDVATIEFKRKFVEALEKAGVKGREELFSLVKELITERLVELPIASVYPPLSELLEKCERSKILSDEEKNYAACFLRIQSEDELLEAKVRGIAEELRRRINEITGKEAPLNTYYAIVRGDGDFMGRLFSGEIAEAIQREYLDLIVGALVNTVDNVKLRQLFSYAKDNNIDALTSVFIEEDIHDHDIAKGICELFQGIKNRGKIPTTPAYHAMLSRALMITALKDVELVEKNDGVVVYAGGDDILATLPVSPTPQTIAETRRHYSLGSGAVRGFHKLGNGMFPSLGLASRSYSLTYGHYRYPMSRLLALSNEKLEEAKESETGKPKHFKKDALSIVYSPRGVKISALIPLKQDDYAYFVEKLYEIAESIRVGELSHSILYDFIENNNTIKSIIDKPNILLPLIRHIVARNLTSKGQPKSEEINRVFEELTAWLADKEGKPRHIIEEFVYATRGYISALRG